MAKYINLIVFTIFVSGWILLTADAYCYKKYEFYCCKTKGWWPKRCVQYCPKLVWQCHGECRNVGKRSQVSQEAGGFSCKFASYDLDGNGKVTYEEFVKSQKMKADYKGTQQAFKSADRNNDKVLTCEELSEAPFDFACIVVCSTSNKDQQDVEEMID